MKAAIIDYALGNLFSVKQACEHVGLSAVITCEKSEILKSDALILPGVGAFGDAMNNLRRLDLIKSIKKSIGDGKPFLGICLGMQLLMSESEEFGLHQGLNIIKGRVVKFPFAKEAPENKVPQVGWNQIFRPGSLKQGDWANSFLKGISQGAYMYFVHSFYVKPCRQEIVLSQTSYNGIKYCSSLQQKNILACQFHPEKSGPKGLRVYQNFASMTKK